MKTAGLLLCGALAGLPLRCAGAELKDAALSAAEPRGSADLIRRAESSLKKRDYKASVDSASRAIELDPTNTKAYLYRARSFNGLKLYERALGDAVEGLRIAPKDPALLRMKARILIRLRDYKAALDAANLALHFDPKNAAAHANKAYAMGAMGDREGMLAELKVTAALDPRFQGSLETALQEAAEGDAVFLFPRQIHVDAGPDYRGSRASKERRRRLIGTLCISGLILLIGGAYVIAAVFRSRSKTRRRRAV